MPSKMLERAQSSAANQPMSARKASSPAGQAPGAGSAAEVRTFEALAETPGALAWRPAGSLDSGSCRGLAAAFESAVSEDALALVDFARVEELGPAGIGMLVALQKRQRAGGGELVLFGLRPRLRRFIDSMGYGSFFSAALDLRSALEYILRVRRDVFPLAANCPACSSRLGLEGPGRSRCRACKAVLTVLPDGTVELG